MFLESKAREKHKAYAVTTNVYDGLSWTIATDSRWSQQCGRWLFYVDDAEFHKIEIANKVAFMFAGRGRRIQEWKDWIRSGPTKANRPEFDGICIYAVEISSKKIRICEGLPIVRQDSAFGGSGARHAFSCWESNKDARKSVDTAKKFDPATGGATKFFNLDTGEHNLNVQNVFAETSIDGVDRAIATRGMIMDISNVISSVPFKLSEVAANNEEVRDIQSKFANGEISADAPSDAMYSVWTDEQKIRVDKALGEIFGW